MKVCYDVNNHDVFEVDPESGRQSGIPVKGDVPKMSWMSGAAFDSKRKSLVVVCSAHMCAYSAAEKKWSYVADLAKVRLLGLAYSPQHDCFYGLSQSWRGKENTQIHKFDPDGKLLAKVQLDESLLSSDPRLQAQLAMLDGGKLTIITPPPTDENGHRLPRPPRCLVVDLVTGKTDSSRLMKPRVGAAEDFAAEEAERLWPALGSEDEAEAERGMNRLIAGRGAAVTALQKRLAAPPNADPAHIDKLIALLNDENAAVREKATTEVLQIGSAAEAQVQKALAGGPAPEAEGLLQVIARRIGPAAQARRDQRLVQVLQEIATPAAIEQLIALSAGDEKASVTMAAKRALRDI